MSGPLHEDPVATTEPVRSVRNPRVVAAVRLHRARDRHATGLTLIEGPHVLDEALRAGVEVLTVFSLDGDDRSVESARGAGAASIVVTGDVLKRVSGTETPRGPVAVIRVPEPQAVSRDCVLADVSDPGNAGTIIRTAAAFGFDVGVGAIDPWSPKVLRAGAGAHFRTRLVGTGTDATIATVPSGGIAPARLGVELDPARTWTVLIGSEAHGLASEVVERSSVAVTIPMPGGTESLNAAVSAAIVMYELACWRSGSAESASG